MYLYEEVSVVVDVKYWMSQVKKMCPQVNDFVEILYFCANDIK